MELTQRQLWLLRAMYLLVVVGQAVTTWPGILFPEHSVADSHSVVSAFLGGLSLLALLGLRYPIKMLPLLLLELTWKSIWAMAFALRMWLGGGLDDYAADVMVAVGLGLIVTPIAIPWKYVFEHYVRSPGDSWRNTGLRPRKDYA